MMTLDQEIKANLRREGKDRLTNVQIGRMYGVSEATVRRHAAKLDVDEFFGIPNSIITSRGSTRRLPDGSYEKITYDPRDLAVVEALTYDDVDKAISNYVPRRYENTSTKHSDDTLVVCAADFQTGKTDEAGGTVALVERVLDILEQWRQQLPFYDTIILADLGDIVENFTNVTSQAQTNDLSLTDQVRVAQRLLLETLLCLAPRCEHLIYVAVPSNHSGVRSGVGSKKRSNAPDDDYGILIQDNIQLAVAGREGLEHVEFVSPSKWEEAVTVLLQDGTGIGFTHGDLAGSQAKMGQWFANMSHAHRSGLHEADVLVHGHFHTPSLSMSGDCRWIIGAPSIDNGSSWFSNARGDRSVSAMLTFNVGGHSAYNWKLWEPTF